MFVQVTAKMSGVFFETQCSIVYSVVGCWQKLVNGVHCSSGTHSQFGIDVRHVSGDILYRRLRRLCPAHDRVRVRWESMRCSHQVRLGTTEATEGDRRIRSTCVRPVSLFLLVFLYLFLVIIRPPDIVCRPDLYFTRDSFFLPSCFRRLISWGSWTELNHIWPHGRK